MASIIRVRVSAMCAVAAVLLAGCSAEAEEPPDPVEPGDWEVGTPEEQGMDSAVLAGAREYAFADGQHTQGVVVIRNGVLVAEWYDDGAGPDSWAASWSMAKGVTSALVGIALDEGHIPSVDEPMTTYYPHWADSPREEVTIGDVLQMSSGLEFAEVYDDPETSDIWRMVTAEPDQLAYAADRPLANPPGTVFNYSSGDSLLLSGVIEQATGMSVAAYAQEKLFDPLGIDQVEWWQDAAGHTLTYCCLDTTSRDFAKFGELYLRDGTWRDQQLVPAEWVADSLTASEASGGSYGYQWWLHTDDDPLPDLFQALGLDGQYLFVVPSLDLVVVRQGTYIKYDGDPIADPNLYDKYPNTLVPDLGTLAPANFDPFEFLAPIVESIQTDD